jgi:hypothetical protein
MNEAVAATHLLQEAIDSQSAIVPTLNRIDAVWSVAIDTLNRKIAVLS